MSIHQILYPRISSMIVVIVLTVQSCTTVRLISAYDEITDTAVTELQKNVSVYFVSLERAIEEGNAGYTQFTSFFDNAKVALNTLQIRAAAFEKNNIVQKHITELTKMIIALEKLHQLGFSSYEQLKPLQQQFNIAFTAIIRLQLALKRGETL